MIEKGHFNKEFFVSNLNNENDLKSETLNQNLVVNNVKKNLL